MTTLRRVRVHAPAKINLLLRVLGTRADGYHEVRTILQSVAMRDTLTFSATRDRFEIVCNTPGCPTDASNLVWRAAAALWRRAGRSGSLRGVRVEIEKRIPMQAGLGGGSSNAAATLRGLAALWRETLDPDALDQIARRLGADVPFFLEGGTVLGLDRGDQLFPLLDRRPAWVVLAVPDFGVSTPDAYRWWDRHRGRADAGINDLQRPVAAHHPEIARLVRRLERLGADETAMSGSGSAVFGLFEREAPARRAWQGLRGPGVRAFLTRTLDRRRFARLARPR